jgi:membrane peptidoglycan carboxypeptidase
MRKTKTSSKSSKNSKLFKILALFFLGIGVLIAYLSISIAKAYFDSHTIVQQAYSSGKLKLKIEDLPKAYQEALLVVEDPNFYQHNGIDLSTPGAGYTTITQGLVKIYFFPDGFSPGFLKHRKLKQSLIALAFNKRVDKNTQLDIFINQVYLGHINSKEVIGFQAGAKVYFEKEFKDLSFDEYLSLVAMIIAPNEFNINKQKGKNQERVEKIKRLLKGDCKPTGLTDVYYENCKNIK